MSSATREWQAVTADGAHIARATVIAMDERAERVRIQDPDNEREMIVCEVLHPPGGQPAEFAAGDSVLIWRPGRDRGLPGVIGRIGPIRAQLADSANPTPEVENDKPDELILEAKHRLVLRVGGGSITIRDDGKILIKGKDLVSHAQRLNRIKGGAVQIN